MRFIATFEVDLDALAKTRRTTVYNDTDVHTVKLAVRDELELLSEIGITLVDGDVSHESEVQLVAVRKHSDYEIGFVGYGIFRTLSNKEVREFQQSARDKHYPGAQIERDIWHPVYVAECDRINAEAVKKVGGTTDV